MPPPRSSLDPNTVMRAHTNCRHIKEPSGILVALLGPSRCMICGDDKWAIGLSARRFRILTGEVIMATEWRIKAAHLGNCNCAYGCPCKFTALPTHGNCRSVVGYEIQEGYFGALRLDGLRAALVTSWPGAIHEGNGTMQVIIDERADENQRHALL